MIRRELDTDLIDRIGNSPKVRPFICYHDHEINWLPVIKGCAVLSNGKDAIMLFEQTPTNHEIFEHFDKDLRLWQLHTLFDETCRGKRAVETGREMLAFMLPKWADVVWGATPRKNRAALWFNRQIGRPFDFRVIGHDDYEADGPVEIVAAGKVS